MLLSEIIYNIQNLKEGGLHSDDYDLSDEQVIFIVNYYRAKLIKQDYTKNMFSLDGVSQDLGKVDVTYNNSQISAIKGASITEELPQLIQLEDGLAIRLIGSIERPYSYIPQGRAPYIKHARFTCDEGYYYPIDNRIVLLSNKIRLTKVPVVGVFFNPVQAKEFADGQAIESYDFEYPLSAHMVDVILKLLVQTEIRFSTLFPDTDTNDAKDDTDIIQ